MPVVTFTYRLQVEAQAKTGVGRTASFVMEVPFTQRVDEFNHNYETGRIVNADLNGDFYPESLTEMVAKPMEEYCLRHGLIYSTVSILTYTVSTDHEDVVVYFNPLAPTKRTTDGSASIYAYLIADSEPAPVPRDVTAVSTSEGIVLSWLVEGHYHGVHIYNKDLELIASIGSRTYEWIDQSTIPGQLYTYYIASYHSNGESEPVKVMARMEEEISVIHIPVGDGETVERKPVAYEEGIMRAFQSGVGDLDDLKVIAPVEEKTEESFSYTVQLKGYEEETIHVFPEREFQYRVVAHNAYGIMVASIPWRVGIIDGKEPMVTDKAGRQELRVPLELEVPPHEENVRYTVELNDPTGFVRIRLDKGGAPITLHPDDYINFYSSEESSVEKTVKTPYYGTKTAAKQSRTVKGKEVLSFQESVSSPWKHPNFTGKNIVEWVIMLDSDNPNVRLKASREPENYAAERSVLPFTMQASIINQTQAPWNPLIRSGFYYLNQAEHYLFGESDVKGLQVDDYKLVVKDSDELFVTPIPRHGSPVIVRDLSGKEMVHVPFYDEKGNPTLENTEEIRSNEKGELLLSHIGIDAATLLLSYKAADGAWKEIASDEYIIEDNYIKLYPSIPSGSLIRIRYRLLRSFIVDHSYDVAGGYAKITLHGATLDESREVSVFYETGEDIYHIGRDIDLNPLKNGQNTGFLYLADSVEPSQKTELEIGSHTMLSTGYDSVFIRAIATDRFGNPVSGDRIIFSSPSGTIVSLQERTDMNGMAMAKFTAPKAEGEFSITAINQTSGTSDTKTVHVKKEAIGSHISVSTSYPVVYPGWNEVTVTAYVYGENQEPVINTKVKFEFGTGVANKTEAMTNQFGAASIVFAANEIPRTGIIRIRAVATDLGIKEDTVLRILGFRYYHKDYFMTGNNLIDIYDRVSARENLGISAQSLAPAEPQQFDLWIDQGDMLFLQTSYQLRDLTNKQEARESLGITQSKDAPESPWANDIWIDEE